MPDGKEEREERKARIEAEKKKPARPNDRYDDEPVYEGQPERGGS